MATIYSRHEDLQARVDLALAQLDQRGLVLIHGPTGSGKSHLSEWLFGQCRFGGGSFQVQEAAGLTSHRFESQLFGHVKGAFTGAVQAFPGLLGLASSGVLLLEGIEDLTLDGQARLLRFLETKKYRPVGDTEEKGFPGGIIMTSGVAPEIMLETGALREDFYFRVAGVAIAWPGMTLRPADFETIFRNMANTVAGELGKSSDTFTEADLVNCQSRSFSGGLHELRNLLFRAGILGLPTREVELEVTTVEPGSLPRTGSLKSDIAVLEKQLLVRGLRAFPNSRQDLADHLGVSLRALMYKLKAHQLN